MAEGWQLESSQMLEESGDGLDDDGEVGWVLDESQDYDTELYGDGES
uniref:Uncharacterized protein n=1 Tax=Moniliophthora roreri TaxID=221103 RepID=A0A0W0F863_MONRR